MNNPCETAFRLSLIFPEDPRKPSMSAKSWDRPSFFSSLSAGAVRPALLPIFWLVGEGTPSECFSNTDFSLSLSTQ